MNTLLIEPVRHRLTSELSDPGSTGGQNGPDPFFSPSDLTCHIHSLREFFPGGKVDTEEKKKDKEREEKVLPIEDWQHLSSRVSFMLAYGWEFKCFKFCRRLCGRLCCLVNYPQHRLTSYNELLKEENRIYS